MRNRRYRRVQELVDRRQSSVNRTSGWRVDSAASQPGGYPRPSHWRRGPGALCRSPGAASTTPGWNHPRQRHRACRGRRRIPPIVGTAPPEGRERCHRDAAIRRDPCCPRLREIDPNVSCAYPPPAVTVVDASPVPQPAKARRRRTACTGGLAAHTARETHARSRVSRAGFSDETHPRGTLRTLRSLVGAFSRVH